MAGDNGRHPLRRPHRVRVATATSGLPAVADRVLVLNRWEQARMTGRRSHLWSAANPGYRRAATRP